MQDPDLDLDSDAVGRGGAAMTEAREQRRLDNVYSYVLFRCVSVLVWFSLLYFA